MSTEVTNPADIHAAKQLPTSVNAGAVAIESERAIAEAQGQLTLAKRFPRSMVVATADMLEACKSLDFAKTAFYAVKNRGNGPSIRFAEEVARVYGNFQYGHRELSRSEGKSEVEVFAWDMEKNNRSTRQITVLHILDFTDDNGVKRQRPLIMQADIDGRIANIASKQMRGRILALMPKALVAAGIAACKLTLAGGNDKPLSERVTSMVEAFGKRSITVEMLSKYIGHSLDNLNADELADLIGVFNAIKEGSKPSEYFGGEKEPKEIPFLDDIKTKIAAATTPADIEALRKDIQALPTAERKEAMALATARVAELKPKATPAKEAPAAAEPTKQAPAEDEAL